ncbi:hypothetical protein SAMN06298216_2631 [Spirosomataceae bacterium TFI 002]|nr:hypothetical protein SAMN06298216_2631 [Spirosomataceae bacterium TFI 002]
MKTLFYIALFFFISLDGNSQVLSSTGSWSPTIASGQISEAGLDYPSTYALQSSANQTLINLQRSGSFFDVYFGNWRVDVRKSDINWDSRLKLEIRRSGNGNGSFFSSINGGGGYQQLNNNIVNFFNGSGFYSNIPIQYRISGFSVLIPVEEYRAEVVFTLIDL